MKSENSDFDLSTLPELERMIKDRDEIGQLLTSIEQNPLLRQHLGLTDEKFAELRQQFDELTSKTNQHLQVVKTFNRSFAQSGWILHNSLSMEVAGTALSIANSGDKADAEQVLVDYYSPDRVDSLLKRMVALRTFVPRMPLATLAAVDYREGRYYASALVVLSLMDGLVIGLSGNQRGPFSPGTPMRAWNSIAGHISGLPTVLKEMGAARTELNPSPITIPYRHGIFHGLDVEYNSKIVAAKAWALLFAVRDWALLAQRDELEPPVKAQAAPLDDPHIAILSNEHEIARMQEWKPRMLPPQSTLFEANVAPEALGVNTPERYLAEYLGWWKKGNYKEMTRFIGPEPEKSFRQPTKTIKHHFRSRPLASFRIIQCVDELFCRTILTTELTIIEDNKEKQRTVKFRLLHTNDRLDPVSWENPEGSWWIQNWHLGEIPEYQPL